MTGAWSLGTPPAQATIDCGPNRHRLVWEHGQLRAVDHPDPDLEAVLSGLGGSEPACLARLRQWSAHAADPRVLALAGRHPGDTISLSADDIDAVRALLDQDDARRALLAGPDRTPTSELSARAEANRRHLELLELLALDPALVRRLQAEVAHNLSGADPIGPADLEILEAATVGRLTPIVDRWSGTDRPGAARPAARPTSVRLGDEPSVRATLVGTTVTVRPDWLATVWGRYLGVVEGFLVLDVHRVVDERAEVTGMGAPGGAPAHLTLRGPAPWHVVRRDGLNP